MMNSNRVNTSPRKSIDVLTLDGLLVGPAVFIREERCMLSDSKVQNPNYPQAS